MSWVKFDPSKYHTGISDENPIVLTFFIIDGFILLMLIVGFAIWVLIQLIKN